MVYGCRYNNNNDNNDNNNNNNNNNNNKWPRGNDRSPESQQVQSLDKVIGGFTIYIGMVAILVM